MFVSPSGSWRTDLKILLREPPPICLLSIQAWYSSDEPLALGFPFGFTENEVLLDIDQTSHKTMDIAIRLSAFSKDSDEALQPLPPLFQSSDAADDQYPH